MDLREHILRIRTSIAAGQYINEASVCTGVVLPLLQELGWPVFDPQIVSPEYTLEGRRVDYALCHPRGKPTVFIEVKQPGKSGGADRQLFEYAFHVGVPIAVLTDGREWHFYLPAGQGHYQERRVYRLDLSDREPGESAERLTRYLGYTAVSSGAALKSASEDYAGVRRGREITETIPIAWRKLLEDQDTLLIDLLADEVEGLCGFKPDLDSVAQFIAEQLKSTTTATPSMSFSRSRPTASPAPPSQGRPESPSRARSPSTPGFVLHGVHVATRNAIDTLIQFLRQLAKRDSTFLERFDALPRHGRSRRFVAKTPRELYPDREDLARDYAHELIPGWWVGTNYGSGQIEQIIRMACEVAGLNVGSDVQFSIPRRDRTS